MFSLLFASLQPVHLALLGTYFILRGGAVGLLGYLAAILSPGKVAEHTLNIVSQ